MATTMPRSAALYDTAGTLALDWSSLYDEHAPRLQRIAARRVGTDHASDVVQEIFVRAYRNRHSLDESRPIGAWLSTIALRASTDVLRRRSARPEVLVDDERQPVVLGGDVDDEFENVVRREGIKAAFDSLPERQQQVFRMLAIDGLSQEEAAREVGISTDAVKSLFARARHSFKESYQAFSERMGVFGGAAVGGTLWKLRSRVQRLQSMVTEHVGAFSTAAAAVTVVAIATVPSTRPTPTMADEQGGTGKAAPAPVQPDLSVVRAETTEAVVDSSAPVVPIGRTAAAVATPAEPVSEPSSQDVRADATASTGRDGDGAGIAVTGSTDGPQDDGSVSVIASFSDCGGVTAGTFCVVVDTADETSPNATE